MELRVIKPFYGKVEDKAMNKGDLVHSTDVERINALVGEGFCVIVSLSDPEPSSEKNEKKNDKKSK
jgi:hypothetical protein